MASVKKFLRTSVDVLAANYRVVTGTGICSEKPFSLLWSGAESQLAYFRSRVFSNNSLSTRRVGRHSIFALNHLLEKYQCDLVATIVNRRFAKMLRQPGDIIVPVWIRCDVELDGQNAYKKSESIRGDLRNIRKNGFTWQVSAKRNDFEQFYERFYLPTVTASHGAALIPADKTQRLELLDSRNMELLQVLRNDQVVAGVSIDYRGEVPELRDSGVLDGSSDLKRAGAVTATYLFAMDYLLANAHSKVGFGFSRGFLDDGVLTYKRKFRPRILPGPDQCILLRTRSLSTATRAVLCSCPCLTWEGNQLRRTYFVDPNADPSGKSLRNQRNKWSFGIEQEKIFDISGRALQLWNTADAA